MKLSVGSVCDRGLSHKRPVNEDRALVDEVHGLFVVCDGVGGHSSGEVASQLAVDTIEEALTHDDGGDVEALLENAVRYANRDIFEMASTRSEYDGMGTTVALLYVDRAARRAIIGHAGDSRVYRYDGAIHRETYDHTDLDDAIRAGRITQQQALLRGKQNTINRALGIESDVQAEFKTVPLADGDAFLLCSDGVTRHIDDDELEELFADGLAAEAMCEEIRSRCYARGAEDNLTAIVVYTAEPRPAQRTGSPRAAVSRQSIEINPAQRRGADVGSRRDSPARAGLLLLLAVALGVAGFFAGRASVAWLAKPKPAVAPVVSARDAFLRGDLGAARTAFTALAAAEPNRAEYHLWLGRTCLEQGETREAVKHLEDATKLDAKAADAYLYLAAAYQRDNRPKEATEALKRYSESVAPAVDPSSPPAASNAR